MLFNLALIVNRLSGALAVGGTRVIGPAADELATALRDEGVPLAARTDPNALTLLACPIDATWAEAAPAAVAVAVDHRDATSAPERISALAEAAAAAGRAVAWAGLVRMGEPPGARAVLVAVAPDRPELAEQLATGPLGLALDPEALAADPRDRRPARVLIASYEIAGPTGNGGIGTAYHSLAHSLARAGHDVTLLFTGLLDRDSASREEEWRASFAADGIAFELLGVPWAPPTRSPHLGVRRAYELHRWLVREHERRPFDIVHVPECCGHGAFVATAKALGLHFHDLEIVVGVHSSTRWVAEANRESIEDIDLLVSEWLERVSVERADAVLSPTTYLVDYMRERGWTLPARTFVQPYARPEAVRAPGRMRCAGVPSELVFFGRLEPRKGLEAFLNAMDLLAGTGGLGVSQVTFLGQPMQVMGVPAEDAIAARAESWGVPWKILPDLGHAEAVAYLQQAPCIAVMPSLVDNSPNTVLEATAMGLPFVASAAGGTAELIDARDVAAATFDPWRGTPPLQPPELSADDVDFDSDVLAAAIRVRLASRNGAVRPAIDDEASDRAYDAWHRAMAGRARPAAPPSAFPSVGVIIVARDRERVRELMAALESGSHAPDAFVAVCDRAPADEELLDIPVIAAAGKSAGAARRRAADHLGTDVVLILRGNEEPDADLVEHVCRAAAAGASDALTLVTRDPRDRGGLAHAPAGDDPDERVFVPVGGPAAASLLYPALLIGPYAVTRAALDAVGGFAPDVFGEDADRELLSRIALAGMRIDVLPRPLATTVVDDPWSGMRAELWHRTPLAIPSGERLVRLLRPYRRKLPQALSDLPALLSAEARHRHDAADRLHDAYRTQQELVDGYEERIAAHIGLEARYAEELERHQALGVSYEQRLAEQRDVVAGYESQVAGHRRVIDAYEARLAEMRSLIELYEGQKEDMRRVIDLHEQQNEAMRRAQQGAAAPPRLNTRARGVVRRLARRLRRSV